MNVSPREFRRLWPEFEAGSWRTWAAVEDAAVGMEPEDAELVARVAGGRALPEEPVRELWAVVGRGGGKSRWAARLAVYFALGWTYKRAPGERVFAGIFAPDRKQAKITFNYVTGLLHAVPALEREIKRETAETVELRGGTTVEVITASKAAPRGRSYALAIVEEAAFLPADDSAEPDRELLRALRPALARVPGSMLVVISSPYARRGQLFRAWKAHYGKESPRVLVVAGDTQTFNPAFDAAEIDRAFEEDEPAAWSEYGRGGEIRFRADVETFVPLEVVEACVVPGRHELPPVSEVRYRAFVDPSGGGQDSFALAIGHAETRDGSPVAVLDALRERRPPYSPEKVVEEFSSLLKTYGIGEVTADRYAGQWPKEAFARHGIEYEQAARPKSDLYRDALALLNSARTELLDRGRLVAQLVGLERRTARGGRDSTDHAPGAHDDCANVVCGVAVLLAVSPAEPTKTYGTWGRSAQRSSSRRPTPPLEVLTARGEEAFAARLADVPPEELTEQEALLLRRGWGRRSGFDIGGRDHVARIVRR